MIVSKTAYTNGPDTWQIDLVVDDFVHYRINDVPKVAYPPYKLAEQMKRENAVPTLYEPAPVMLHIPITRKTITPYHLW